MDRLTPKDWKNPNNLMWKKLGWIEMRDEPFRSAISEALQKLAHYEDLEEQGRLVELPCKVGDTVYEVQEIRQRIQALEIISIYIGRMGEIFFNWELKNGEGIYKNLKGFGLSQLGKTVYLTREEAEAKLAEGGEQDGI